jgi:ABC-2 type transport system permease protein
MCAMSTADAPAAAGTLDAEPDAVIHTEDLTKIYAGTDFAAVDRLNLDVRAGEIFGLLGPNGAGKTTTAGMLTTRAVPTSGRAFLGGIDVGFQGVQSIALAMAQEFGFTREIEDRVQAPCPIWLVAIAKVLSGAAQGVLSAILVLPMASVVHAPGVEAHLTLHWWIIVTFVPLACIAMGGLGLVLGTSFEPRNIGLMFGFIILPITFLGGTYYSWTRLAPVEVGGWHWLQTLVLINPLIYVNEGMRAAFTEAPHMHLYVIHPVVFGFGAAFLAIGLYNFRRRVLS